MERLDQIGSLYGPGLDRLEDSSFAQSLSVYNRSNTRLVKERSEWTAATGMFRLHARTISNDILFEQPF